VTGDGPDGSPTDRELLAAHVAGDPEAFAELFRRHRDRLWAVALRTTANPEDAADALQDALVSAFRRGASYRGDAAVTTWLHRIVVNACLDRIRRAQVRRAEPLPGDLDTRRATTVEDLPEEATEQADRRAVVLAALAQLPVEQRTALVLVDMEGYSVEETADLLGIASGTVKSRCSRGRARLLPLLEGLRTSRPGNPTGGPHVPSPEAHPDHPSGGGPARLSTAGGGEEP
jgi:RNA polymerase sigma-70 factor (ECF subfamily)